MSTRAAIFHAALCSLSAGYILPELPPSLKSFGCSDNHITELPELPVELAWLNCSYNNLRWLPQLPTNLSYINCSFNQLVALRELPSGLTNLNCIYNELVILDLSGLSSLNKLDCAYNNFEDVSDAEGFTGMWDSFDFNMEPQRTGSLPLYGLSPWATEEVLSLDIRDYWNRDCMYYSNLIPTALKNDLQAPIQRDEFMALLVNAYRYMKARWDTCDAPFTDISDSSYKTAIELAYCYELVSGISATEFSPFGLLTREQAFLVIERLIVEYAQ